MSKSYEEGYRFIESITTNTYQWPVARTNASATQKNRTAEVHEVTETTTLTSQVAQIHQMMKNMMTPEVPKPDPVKVVIDASAVSCVYCEGAHLFEKCPVNLVSVNYVGNTYNKNNNPYNNTYNPAWRNL